jgi:hypothetical protein
VEKVKGHTELRDLQANFQIQNGWMVLSQPLRFQSTFGSVDLGGRIGLDHALALNGHVTLSQQTVSAVAGNLPVPGGSVTVPLSLQGSLEKPELGAVDARALAEGAAKQQMHKGTQQVEENIKRQARRKLNDALRGLGGGGKTPSR